MVTDAVEMPARADLWFCADGHPHTWLYRGKNKGYRCHHCGVECSKEQLKAATDA